MTEYEVRDARLRDEIDLLQRDKEHLLDQINLLQKRVRFAHCRLISKKDFSCILFD